jgi:ParB family chromosome partitioning protein
MEMALAENIQREDLNAIEIALAYQRLAETTGMTQERMSERLGKSRASITNYMRLLKLPAQIQMALKNRDIDMGHARALLSLDSPSQQLKVFKDVHRNGYSVRKVEEMVQRVKKGESLQEVRKLISPNQLPLEYSILRDRLSELFKTKVTMTCSPEVKGKISINFSNEDELEFVMQVFDKVKKSQK